MRNECQVQNAAALSLRGVRSSTFRTWTKKAHPTGSLLLNYVIRGAILIICHGTGQCRAMSRKESPASSGLER